MEVDVAAFTQDVQGWTDQYLAEQVALGREGYADPAAWAILAAEARRRSATRSNAQSTRSDPGPLRVETSASDAKRTLSAWGTNLSLVLVPVLTLLYAVLGHMQHPALFVVIVAALAGPRFLARLRLRDVAMDRLFLYVAGLREEIVAPLSEVDRVTHDYRVLAGHLVTIHLRHQTALGSQVTFLPSGVGLARTVCARVITEIEDAVRRAQGG